MQFQPVGTRALWLIGGLLIIGGMMLNITLLAFMAPLLVPFVISCTVGPPDLNVSVEPIKDHQFVGDEITVNINFELTSGIGPVLLATGWPDGFSIQSGDSTRLIWKGLTNKTFQWKQTVRLEVSGNFESGYVTWQSRDFAQLLTAREGREKVLPEIKVHPRNTSLRRSEAIDTNSQIPKPSDATTKIGLSTMSFEELREYQPGDSFRKINWKATARNVKDHGVEPVVNEYEQEGQQLVWIILDGRELMNERIGHCRWYDHGREAVISITNYYLELPCRVGVSVWSPNPGLVRPETGRQHKQTILDQLEKSDPGQTVQKSVNKNLEEIVRSAEPYFQGSRPLGLFVTKSLGGGPQLQPGLKRLLQKCGQPGHANGVLFVNLVLNQTSKRNQPIQIQINELRSQALRHSVPAGVQCLNWNPGAKSLLGSMA